MYEIIFSDNAEKEFDKLDRNVQERITKTLDRTIARPYSYFEKLTGQPLYKLRAGDYRILAEIRDDKLIILVIKVGHRKKVYDNI